jgi:predicted Zn-dependent protease
MTRVTRARFAGVMVVCGAAAAGGLVLSAQSTPAEQKDVVIQALRDELERSRKITLNNIAAPYFISYAIDEGDHFTVTASLGGVLTRRRDRAREPRVQVRVGDYKFDNTNFAGVGFGTRYDLGRLPLDDSYPLLRRYFWLFTDSAYKGAVEGISRKQAALRNITQSEQLNDMAKAEPVRSIRPFKPLAIDEEGWTKRVRALSAVFAKYPEVRGSLVEMETRAGGLVFVNSEGTEVREPEAMIMLRARAAAQAPDGMMMRDEVTFHALDASRMPGDAEIAQKITAMADNVVALAKAPKGEDYSGPVLFSGEASAQIFAEVLGRNLVLTRRPVADGGRGGGFAPSELEGRMGARVLPETFDVVDDPTQKEWRGRPLFGSYEVDREGVLAKPLKLVEKGVLKNYLLTRQPVRGFEGSNGRARLPGNFGASTPAMSNLFVNSSETVPVAELKTKLIELIKARGKAYGILVRKMDFPSTASLDEARRLLTGNQTGRPVSIPLSVFRVYPDGREELVRGLRFRGMGPRSLRDIVATGDDSTTLEFMDNGAVFALVGAANFATEVSVVAPSVLIDDLEMHPIEEELPKLPLVAPPELTR